MIAGIKLMTSHAESFNLQYLAAVRMRSDLSEFANRRDWIEQFPTVQRWASVRRLAVAHAAGVAEARRDEVFACDRPRSKRYDFCLWSVPALPLERALLGPSGLATLRREHDAEASLAKRLVCSRDAIHREDTGAHDDDRLWPARHGFSSVGGLLSLSQIEKEHDDEQRDDGG